MQLKLRQFLRPARQLVEDRQASAACGGDEEQHPRLELGELADRKILAVERVQGCVRNGHAHVFFAVAAILIDGKQKMVIVAFAEIWLSQCLAALYRPHGEGDQGGAEHPAPIGRVEVVQLVDKCST